MKNIQELINKEYSKILEAKNYLNDTDYKLLRELDGGEKMDSETRLKRAEARSKINELENKIDFLVNCNVAKEEVLSTIPDYIDSLKNDAEKQVKFESPFLETQLMVNECAELQYEKMPQTGLIKIYEQGNKRKDRYTSCSYGSWFIDKLEIDLLKQEEKYDFSQAPVCVSAVTFD